MDILTSLAAFLLFETLCVCLSGAQDAPFFISNPQGDTVVNSNRKTLSCQATGTAPINYRWQINGTAIGNVGTDQHTYVFSRISKDDVGMYRCVAQNLVGSVLSRGAEIHVSYFEDYGGSPQTITVTAGDAATLTCPTYDSYPTPTITWQYNGIDIVEGQENHRFTTSDQRLVILATNESDQGTYTCKAVNSDYGQTQISPAITLTVQGTFPTAPFVQPSLVIPPKDTVVTPGQTFVEMECIVNAVPLTAIQVTWYKDGAMRQQGSNPVYAIFNPTEMDAGSYRCDVQLLGSSFDSISATADLTYYITPVLTDIPSRTTISPAGSTHSMPCKASGVPPPRIKWYRNAVDVELLGNSRFTVESNGDLQLTNLQKSDDGMFQCQAINDIGEEIADTWLQVKEIAPVITTAPNDTTILERDTAILLCVASGAPEPTMAWYKDGTLIASADYLAHDRLMLLGAGDLMISQAVRSDSGTYTCVATNTVGDTNATAILTVYEQTSITQKPTPISTILGETSILNCVVQHDSRITPDIVWSIDGVVISVESSQRHTLLETGSLRIEPTIAQDTGLYTCSVTSIAGNDVGSANLTVLQVPYKPLNVVAQQSLTESRTIIVSWMPGFNGNSPLIRYILEQKEDDSSFREVEATVHPWLTEISVTGVKPSRRYQYQLRAQNNVGISEYSDPSNVVHLPEEPPDLPPQSLRASAISISSIRVQWQEPPYDSWNGALQGYQLKWRLTGYPTVYSHNITNYRQTSYDITGLITWTSYDITVAAFNGGGVGAFSNVVQVRTKEGVPTDPPQAVDIQVVSSTAFRYQFSPPPVYSINGMNLGYKLLAWEPGDEANPTVVIVPHVEGVTRFEGTIDTLKKFTQYEAAVLCYTSPGDGPMSTPLSLTTLMDVPGPVSNLRLVNIYDTSLEVSWQEPLEVNGVLLGYTISWEEVNKTSTLSSADLQAHETDYTVTGLTAQTTYLIQVWARTEVGPGEKTATIISSGVPPERPQPPTNLRVTDVRARSVKLQFIPGFDGDAGITLWTVEARVGQSSRWEAIFEYSDPSAREFVVTGLSPYTYYTFRMFATNVAGSSNASEPSVPTRTSSDAPEIAPSDIRVRAYSTGALRVTWVPLDDSEWNGPPAGYIIYWRAAGSQAAEQTYNLTSAYDNDHIIQGLDHWTQYDVRIKAYNEDATGPSSAVKKAWTNEAVPSAGPVNIQVVPVTSSSINVLWGDVPEADQNGEILGFKVLFQEIQGTLMYMDVPGNDSREATLAGLRGYTVYTITVLAYTRVGDGAIGNEVPVRTLESVPSAPVGITFPVVELNSVTITWQEPLEPNGPNLRYKVGYRLQSAPESSLVEQEVEANREYSATNLQAEQTYLFEVTARNSAGSGETATVLVVTTTNRTSPEAPSKPSVDHIKSRQVRISWTPGNDGNSPLRFYAIDLRVESGPWVQHRTNINPSLVSYTVDGLEPYTAYHFRIKVYNDVGASPNSPSSDPVVTDQDVPDGAPTITGVTPVTVTSLLVTWSAPSESETNGPLLGHRIQFRQLPGTSYMEENIPSASTTQYELLNLVQHQNYELKMAAYNARGLGPYSAPVTVYVGEAVPSEAPSNVQIVTVSSSRIQISWTAPSVESQNGGLQGYKVTYWERASRIARTTSNAGQKTKTFPASTTVVFLDELTCFTEYGVEVKGYNAAGDGPASSPVYNATSGDRPSKVEYLRFDEIRMSSLNVSWGPPTTPCGVITHYRLFYQPLQPINGERTSVTVTLPHDQMSYSATDLGERVHYMFEVRADTEMRNGKIRESNITTGPQEGAPDSPVDVTLETAPEGVTVSWRTPDHHGDEPITGYVIESHEIDQDKWELVSDSIGPDKQEYLIPHTELDVGATYIFRIMAESPISISEPIQTEEYYVPIGTPGAQKNFYEQWWFLVIIALVGVIVIILVGATLCMLGRSRLYVDRKVMKGYQPNEVASTEDGGFSSFEMDPTARRSQRNGRTHSRGGVYARTNSYTSNNDNEQPHLMTFLGPSKEPPPRPSPGSIQYSEEEESKHYEDMRRRQAEEPGENSSLTEKADLQSLSESISSDIDLDEDVGAHGQGPQSFVNHYASLSGTQSWRRQQYPPKTSGPGSNAYSYTDSEPDPVPTVDGRTLYLQNNLATMPAGSRAPVHGFSSFV
ncbi:protein sidekick-2-like [Diadema antillarum]|uniref:protein sidekick-2-like n=2 Tax=Diadema antillarum TaxID=105358 RepID=UPI003A836CD7